MGMALAARHGAEQRTGMVPVFARPTGFMARPSDRRPDANFDGLVHACGWVWQVAGKRRYQPRKAVIDGAVATRLVDFAAGNLACRADPDAHDDDVVLLA